MKRFIVSLMLVSLCGTGYSLSDERSETAATSSVQASDIALVKGAGSKHSIRVGLRTAPGVGEVKVEGPLGSAMASTHDEGGGQVDILYVRRFMGADGTAPVGGLLGGGLFLNSHGAEDPDSKVELTNFGVMLEGGAAAGLGDRIMLEILPFFGVGFSNVELTDKTGAFVFENATGPYVMYGIKGGVFVLLGSVVELGLELGYSGFSGSAEYEFIGFGDVEATFTGGGAQAGAVIAFKF